MTNSAVVTSGGEPAGRKNRQEREQQQQQQEHQESAEQMQSDADSLDETLRYDHQCYICDKIFSANSNLNRHLRKIHNESVQSPYNNVKCALCESQLASSSLYIQHLEKDHEKTIETEYLTFATEKEFDEWKHTVETMTTSQFIKSRGQKQTKDVNKTYYSCNRSGYFVSKAKTQKNMKRQGSRKINGRCPASMNVKVNTDQSHEVKFIKTHVGHDFDLIHLDLSEKDRDLIVEKLTSGVTKRDIIRQIRSTTELHQSTFVAAATASPASAQSTPISPACSFAADGRPIVINSRSSIPGCSEQQIEVVIPATSETSTPSIMLAAPQGGDPGPVSSEQNGTTKPPPLRSYSGRFGTRLHLATTKDIHNIINSKHLDSKKIRHNYDLHAIEAWIQEMEEHEERGSTVLFYKDQGEKSERFPKLREDDFMLVIMKDGQASMLKKQASNCIVIDSTHNVLCEYLHLAYMSVIDQENRFFPVAFMFSTRTDLDTLEVFYTLIRQKAGQISTRTLIADEFHDFYQAWWRVMSMPLHNLLTPWSVFDSWSKKFGSIQNREKLRKIKKQLRTLLTETESDKFERSLTQIISDFRDDSDTSEFMEHFDDQFAKNPDVWSSCLRKQFGITNHKLWSTHEKFKTVYKEGKNSKKMCKYITCLMGLFEDEQLEDLAKIEEEDTEKNQRALAQRHKKGVDSDSSVYEVAVEPPYWLCPSECATDVYDEIRPINQLKSAATAGRALKKCCDLVCADCKTCRHKYKCTCLDYLVNLNMCKHIHRISAICKQS